ncbi:MAG TPA: hypothetical protein DEO84_10225 [candidate division Zixibacteria bacterium]|nr:hypothetical protein [candidate division Zixibacteria bacterium]HBZ01681.1 hypothetical protein [candidate division Zixibacteria bacterium]
MKKLILLLTIAWLSCLWGTAFSATVDRIQNSGLETKQPIIPNKQIIQRQEQVGLSSEASQAQKPLTARDVFMANQLPAQQNGANRPILQWDTPYPTVYNIPSPPPPVTPPTILVNDNCADAVPVPLTDGTPLQFTGNNAGATPDCPYLGPPEVWEAFTTTECMDVTIDFCGTNPVFWVAFTVIANSCPCGTLIYNSGFSRLDCPDFNATLRFSALPAGTYYIPIASFGPSVGDYVLNVHGYNCPPPATNDNCADAIPIGNVTDLRFTTSYATFDGQGTCMTSPNIWYVYTAECTGNASASLLRSMYDTQIAVYDGGSCDPISNLLACNDNFEGSPQSDAIFPVVEGQQYLIEIGGSGTSVGNGWLTLSCDLIPSNDNCTDVTPTHLDPGTPIVFTGTTVGASDDCPMNGGYPEVWHAITTDVCMDLTLDYCGTTPVFGNVFGIINTGCPCGSIIYSSSMSQTCPDGNWILHFTALGPGTYYIPILSDAPHGFYGPYTMNVSGVACPQAPPNDNCTAVEPQPLVVGAPLTFTGNNIGATLDCPNLGNNPEVWEAFTTNECMDVTIDYCGTDPLFNQVYVAISDACPCGNIILAQHYNFDVCGDGNASITFYGLPAGTYYAPIFSAGGALGPYTMHINGVPCPPPPQNDLCQDAIPVTIPSSTPGTTLSATVDDAPICYTLINSPGVWYSLIGNGNIITATTCAAYTNYDTRLDVYSGTCDQLVCVAGNDDACSLPPPNNANSTVTFCSELGATYYILVQGFEGDRGNFQLDVSEDSECQPPPTTPTCDANSLFGQSPTYPGGMFNFLNSDANATPVPFLVQDNFTNVTGDITSIKFWGLDAYFNIGWYECVEDPMTFEITFYEDNGGAPGAVVNSYSVNVTGTPTGVLYNDLFDLNEFEATLEPSCTLTNGWISIQGTSIGGDPGDCWFMWANSLGGDHVAYQNSNLLGEDLAFCLGGRVCDYVVGDANGSGTFTGLDVTYSVRYFKGGPHPPFSCECTPGNTWYVSGDVNGSCTFSGLDITYMVRYFKGGAHPIPCADCPPGGLLAPLTPGELPSPVAKPIQTPSSKVNSKAGGAE